MRPATMGMVVSAFLRVAVLGLWAGATDAQLLSPGELAQPHAELESMAKCTQCHVLGRQVQPERCLACHETLAARVRAQAGYHGDKATGCIDCHSDHRGRAFQLVRWDRDAFDHTQAGYALEGKHAEVRCDQCHRTPSYIGLSTTCSSCHQDEHRGQLGENCSGCHSLAAWQPTTFEHDKARFPLREKHAQIKCDGCHRREVDAAASDTARIDGSPADSGFVRYRDIPFSTCTDCHQDEHRGQFISTHPVAASAPGDDIDTDCTACHSEAGWKPARFDHATARFRLQGKHVPLACTACHRREPTPEGGDLQRFRPLAFEGCADCHGDAHRGQFTTPDRYRDCASCHTDTGWVPAAIDHDATRYPLADRHATVTCDKCHHQDVLAPGVTGRRYRPLAFADCAACHADPHAGQFAERACATCHTVAGWKTATDFDHEQARFPLRGAHVTVTCDKCHGGTPGEAPPRFRPLPFSRCSDCHADYHEGQFTASSATSDCAACHVVTAWKPASTFDHEQARYRLDGAHVRVACEACHTLYTTGTGDERRRYRPLPMECAACHR